MIAIIVTLIALGIVIFVHEFGHMIVAKSLGIGILEFSIGMGPKIFSKKIKETTYSLRILPVGGFVSVAGLDTDKNLEIPDNINYYKKSYLARLLTVAAGSVFNILLGLLIFFCIFTLIGVPQPINTIDKILPKSPAAKVGLLPSDKIIRVNGIIIKDLQKDLISVIHASANKPITLSVLRDSLTKTIILIPTKSTPSAKIGTIGVYFKNEVKRHSVISAAKYSVIQTYNTITLVFKSLIMLFNREVSLKELAGPIGIVQIASFQLSKGLLYFFNIMAVISISLGVVNLFPFPVLDGGHIFLLLIEWIMRRPLNNKIATFINNTGAVVLITLMVLIVLNDLVNWGERVSLLKKLMN
ncbi:MAG: RIP metalloprotease RseP [Candidatus Margulisiibacteriota bacterium]|jgi:regulator of sigma E protease